MNVLIVEEGEETAMEDTGICTACEEFDLCVLRRRNRKPVLFCEEFQLPAPPPKRVEIGTHLWDSGKRYPATVSEKAARGRSSYTGLCRTCRRLPTCRFSKPGGGTWLCPNYEEDDSTGLKQ